MATKRISLSGFDAVDFSNKTNSRQEKKQDFVPPLYQRHLKNLLKEKKN
jgi:hypothetical protein